MLGSNSFSRQPVLAEKTAKVKILRAIYVGGKACEVGSTASLSLSDAQALRNSVPPSVEIL
jgi:hypothetical protein